MIFFVQIMWVFVLLFVSQSIFSMPSLEAYGKLETFSDVSISPSGERIAYRRTLSDDSDALVVFSLKEGKQIGGLDVKNIDPKGSHFANDNSLILVGSKHVNLYRYKHDFDMSTAFVFDINKNKVTQLIKPGEKLRGKKKVTVGQQGLGRVFGVSPDGKSLFMPAFVSERNHAGNPDYSLLKVNLNGKGSHRIVSKGTNATNRFYLDLQGNVLAREIINEQNKKHSIDLAKGRGWVPLYGYEFDIPTHNFIGLNADFSALIFSRDDENGYLQLSLSDGTVKPLDGLNVNEESRRLIVDRYGVVVGIKYSGFLPSYHMLDDVINERVQSILTHFKEHAVYLSDWTDDWKHIVVRVEGLNYVGDYFLFSDKGKGEKQLTFLLSSRPDITVDDVNPIGITKYQARDGLPIPTLLTLPKSKMDNLKKLPTIVMPHGGPASYDSVGFDFMAQAFASRGYLVIQPQFRGSVGFGKAHYEAGWGEWGKGMQNDLSDAVAAYAKAGYVDTERVCIVGASYGGYAALAGAAFTPDLYKCAVSIAGVSHLPKMLAADKSRYGKKSWVLNYWNRSILDGDYDKPLLKELSPYYSADKVKTPVLLLHGEDDTVVEYEQSKLMYKAINKAKGDVQLVKLKNDDHHLQDSATRIQAVMEMVNFVEQHIGSI